MLQKDLARVVGMHQVRFNAIIRGRVDIGMKTAKKLRAKFGGSLELWSTPELVEEREQLLSKYTAS